MSSSQLASAAAGAAAASNRNLLGSEYQQRWRFCGQGTKAFYELPRRWNFEVLGKCGFVRPLFNEYQPSGILWIQVHVMGYTARFLSGTQNVGPALFKCLRHTTF